MMMNQAFGPLGLEPLRHLRVDEKALRASTHEQLSPTPCAADNNSDFQVLPKHLRYHCNS